MSTRRDFLRRAALFSSSASLTQSLLAAVQQAATIAPNPGSSFLDAEHVVILMQENRSFDHTFGHLRGVRGFNDPRAVTLPNQNPVWLQSNAAGDTYAPFHLNIKETKSTWLGSLPHGWPDQTGARADGNHDGWLEHKASGRKECAGMPLTLGFYNRADLPFYYALADAFTVCDQHFCSSLTGTTPNRLYLWTGTIREAQNNTCRANVLNSDVDYGVEARWTTFPERLEQAGISWRVYQNELSLPSGFTIEESDWLANFTDNPLEWFTQYQTGMHPAFQAHLAKIAPGLPAEIEALEKQPATPRLRRTIREKKWLLAQHERWSKVTTPAPAIHAKAFTTNTADPHYRELATHTYQDGAATREMKIPRGDVLYQFRQDVATGKLPAVSWIVSPENFSDHAGAPWYGAWYVAEVINILTQNPEVWKKTIFILTYDENDGYFDHVPPFVAPDPLRPETGRTSPGADGTVEYAQPGTASVAGGPGPIGLGFRVPFVVASPWSRGGFVNSQVCDHTSVLQLLEKVLSHRYKREIRETNISPWRRAVCGDLTSVFRPAAAEPMPKLPTPSREAVLSGIHQAQFKQMPSGFGKTLPRQEPGTRPSTALPYDLYADGALTSDKQGFRLVLTAKKGAGSGFHVYTPGLYKGQTKLRTRAYAVAAGENVTDTWELAGFPGGNYHLNVCGPNGFLREFVGSAADPALEVEARYTPKGELELVLVSRGAAVSVVIKDESYGSASRRVTVPAKKAKAVLFDCAKSHRWYDFSLSVTGAPGYRRRLAGRVENGASSFSDPAMSGT